MRVGAIYHRNDPILIGQPPAKPTFPGRQPSLAGMAAIWDALEAAGGEYSLFAPSFDVKENKEGYVFRADLPGVKEEDLEIALTGNRLTIAGKRCSISPSTFTKTASRLNRQSLTPDESVCGPFS